MIVLALTVALVGPYFVDWTSYRADFEREASRILGREVKVLGTASARLLPFPSVTFTDVSVAGVEPGETAMTIETFSMDAELAPFLSGEVLIFDMRLVRPSATVEIDADGALSWAVRPNVPVGASNITLERLTITEGKIAVRHAGSGRVHELSEINATLSARALSGPWRMDGSMRVDGMRSKVAISTGPLDADGAMRLRVRAQPERFDVVVETDGDARIEAGRAHYEGAFKVFAESASSRLRGQSGETFPVADNSGAADGPPAYRVSGAFDLDHKALEISEFLFETGSAEDPYTAEGSAELVLGAEPRFLIKADGAQVRFEDAVGEGGAGVGLDQRLAALREFMLDMPRPTIPGRVEVKLPAIVAGDTTVRDVHLLAEPSETGWNVASLGATLPGRTTLEAEGRLDIQDRLSFDGKLLLAVGQPSGFAAWLSRDVDEAIRRLPAAGFSATVELSDERQLFRDLELVLGSARFRGEIDSATPAGARPSLALRLDGDALDVEGMTAFASLFVSEDGDTHLADSDVSIEVAAGPVSAFGLQAETLDTALRLKDGRLEIDRLSIGGLAGANVSATGVVKDLATTPTGNLDASVIAPDLAPLVEQLSERFPASRLAEAVARRAAAYPGLLQDAAIQLVASAAPGANGTSGMALSATGEAGGTHFSLTASSDDTGRPLADAPLTLDLTARNEEASAIYALAGLPALPIDFAGPAEIELSFDGIASEGARASLSLGGDNMAAAFDGTLSRDGEATSMKGSATIQTDDLQPWLATAGVSLPGMGFQLPVNLASELDSTGDLLVLSGISGEIAGASIAGDINAQMRNALPHLTGALALGRFDLALVAEMAVGAAALSGDGMDWPEAAFAQGVATPFSGDLELSVDELAFGDTASASDARMALRLGPDGVFLSEARATLHGGALSGNLDFRNDAGTGLLSGQVQLDDVRPASVIGDVGIDGTASLTATFTASGKSLGGIVSSLAGSGTVAIDGPVIDGIDPGAFAAILASADLAGPDIDAAATAVFAPDLIRKGEFRADRADLAFTIANGTLRAPPILLTGDGATLAAELRADLMSGTVGAEATLAYEAGPETLVGSEPAVRLVAEGPPSDVGVLVDTEPLAQFLTQRALELEQQRVEAMQASLLEKQRHRREVRYYAALAETRERAAEEAARLAEEERRAAEELRLLNEEAERRAAEEAAREAAEQAAREAAEAAAREAEQEAERQRLLEEETRVRQQEEARQAEAEAERQQAERAANERALEIERRQAEDTERQRAEDERLRMEVEALLRAREPALTPDTNTIERAPVTPPETVNVTPMPAPRGRAAAPAAAEDSPAQPATSVFSERNLSIDGLMRAIGADR